MSQVCVVCVSCWWVSSLFVCSSSWVCPFGLRHPKMFHITYGSDSYCCCCDCVVYTLTLSFLSYTIGKLLFPGQYCWSCVFRPKTLSITKPYFLQAGTFPAIFPSFLFKSKLALTTDVCVFVRAEHFMVSCSVNEYPGVLIKKLTAFLLFAVFIILKGLKDIHSFSFR